MASRTGSNRISSSDLPRHSCCPVVSATLLRHRLRHLRPSRASSPKTARCTARRFWFHRQTIDLRSNCISTICGRAIADAWVTSWMPNTCRRLCPPPAPVRRRPSGLRMRGTQLRMKHPPVMPAVERLRQASTRRHQDRACLSLEVSTRRISIAVNASGDVAAMNAMPASPWYRRRSSTSASVTRHSMARPGCSRLDGRFRINCSQISIPPFAPASMARSAIASCP